MKKGLLLVALIMACLNVQAANIGFGLVKGVKVYDMDGDKSVVIYLDDGAERKEIAGCGGVGRVTIALHEKDVVDRITSVALAAYAAGKKVRLYSSQNTCEIDAVVMQESYF